MSGGGRRDRNWRGWKIWITENLDLITENRVPGGSYGKESACYAGDLDSVPGSGRSPGEGIATQLQYSCLENPVDGGAWWAKPHGVTESQTS